MTMTICKSNKIEGNLNGYVDYKREMPLSEAKFIKRAIFSLQEELLFITKGLWLNFTFPNIFSGHVFSGQVQFSSTTQGSTYSRRLHSDSLLYSEVLFLHIRLKFHATQERWQDVCVRVIRMRLLYANPHCVCSPRQWM